MPKRDACGKKKVMHLLLTLLLTAAQGTEPRLGSDAAGPPRSGPEPGPLAPQEYRKDPATSWKFNRKPSAISNDAVTLRMSLVERKLPLVPIPPELADLLKIDPSLTDVKFTGSVTTWKGRAVPTGSYEGFVPGRDRRLPPGRLAAARTRHRRARFLRRAPLGGRDEPRLGPRSSAPSTGRSSSGPSGKRRPTDGWRPSSCEGWA